MNHTNIGNQGPLYWNRQDNIQFYLIVATSENNVIGKDNFLPWNIPSDMQYFKKITTGNGNNAVLMGRKTFETLSKPLPNRLNIILTRNIPNDNKNENVFFCSNIEDAVKECNLRNKEEIFVIGGAQIYNFVFENFSKYIKKIYFTKIHEHYDGDVTLPPFNWDYFQLVSSCRDEKEKKVEYLIYEQQDALLEEYQYLDLISKTLQQPDLCSFGNFMQFDLKKGFPLLTTKKMFLRGVIEELLWFLRGETNSNILKEKNVHIWDKNGSREYLDSVGLAHHKQGDLGPVYGFNFRHYGASYINSDTDYTGQGTDQVQYVLNLIKNEPSSRRILLNLWNPNQLDQVALPACHVLYQFKVHDHKLSCCLYQRSGDIGLGIPFNIASASLLTFIFAHLSNLGVGTLSHCIGDAHIYKEHVECLQEQLRRKPFCFPILKIESRGQEKVEDFKVDDFIIRGYQSHEQIKMPLVV